MPQLANLRTPLGNLTSKILNSVASLKKRMRMKDDSITHYGFTALKPSKMASNTDADPAASERVYIDETEYEHNRDSYDDVYSGEF